MIISFAWTTQALIEGRKTMTRRDWKPRAIANLQRAYDRGEIIHQAWDKVPYAGGRRVGFIQLTQRPYLEMLRDIARERPCCRGWSVGDPKRLYPDDGVRGLERGACDSIQVARARSISPCLTPARSAARNSATTSGRYHCDGDDARAVSIGVQKPLWLVPASMF